MHLRAFHVFFLPTLALASPAPPKHATCSSKPPAFILAGDSTTAVQSTGGGGWGNGFLSFLKSPAWGVNLGHNGATTVSFVEGGDWARVTSLLQERKSEFNVYVTIQFGHNDQKPEKNISLAQYQSNLETLARQIHSLGGNPVLLTPLTRRNFVTTHQVDDSLHDERLATISAAQEINTTCLDLNQASIDYVNTIGNDSAMAYNLNPTDRTHLNDWGSVVFGRMVADLLLEQTLREEEACLESWIASNETLSWQIWHGIPA